jgi:membrane protein YdbS with pleckstrin-like domain
MINRTGRLLTRLDTAAMEGDLYAEAALFVICCLIIALVIILPVVILYTAAQHHPTATAAAVTTIITLWLSHVAWRYRAPRS